MLPEPAKMGLRYLRRVFKGFDQFCNVLTGGECGESISYRAAKLRRDGNAYGCIMCRFRNIFQSEHCARTIKAYEGKDAPV